MDIYNNYTKINFILRVYLVLVLRDNFNLIKAIGIKFLNNTKSLYRNYRIKSIKSNKSRDNYYYIIYININILNFFL